MLLIFAADLELTVRNGIDLYAIDATTSIQRRPTVVPLIQDPATVCEEKCAN